MFDGACRCERRRGRGGEALQLATRALALRPACPSALAARQKAEELVEEGRPVGWSLGEGMRYIDDTETVCSSV